MQPVPTLDLKCFVAELLVARDAVHVRGDVVFLLEDLLGAQHLHEDGARPEQRDTAPAALALSEEIDPAQDPVLDARRHRRHRVVLVVQRQVVEDVGVVDEHAADTVAHDDRGLVGEGRVVGADVRHGRRE